jgi:Ca-activated chloride channel family protein
MNRARLIFGAIVLVAVVVIVAGLLLQDRDRSSQGGVPTQPATQPEASNAGPAQAGAVHVEIHSSNTKEDWMDQVVATFNEGDHTVGDKPIFVTVQHVGSGSSMSDILDGEIQPVVWSPGSDLWVTAINQSWRDRTGRALTDESGPATLRLPLAIAMWRPMAEALGWPDTPIGWDDLADLSTNPEGWAAYGHPEWGSSSSAIPIPNTPTRACCRS